MIGLRNVLPFHVSAKKAPICASCLVFTYKILPQIIQAFVEVETTYALAHKLHYG